MVQRWCFLLPVLIAATALPAHAHATPATERISVTARGIQGNGNSAGASISANGRYVAFLSEATNLLPRRKRRPRPGDTPVRSFLFVHDRARGRNVFLRRAGSDALVSTAVSETGRYIAFPQPISGVNVLDRRRGRVMNAAIAALGWTPFAARDFFSMSANGRYLAFQAYSSDNRTQIQVRDLRRGRTENVVISSRGEEGNGERAFGGWFSGEGRFVSFTSDSSNLVPGDVPGTDDSFVRDRGRGLTFRVPGGGSGALLSDDGRYVTYTAGGPPDAYYEYGRPQVYWHDRETGETRQVSSLGGAAAISGDGRAVLFEAPRGGSPERGPDSIDVFLHHVPTGETVRVNLSPRGNVTNEIGGVQSFGMSADGRFVTFSSWSRHHVSGDTNSRHDVFVRGPFEWRDR
jgi:Tol biopolymer transport system component